MKKIAIFSDIHGNYQALKSILEDINKDTYDYVICLGDVIGMGPNSKECLSAVINSHIIMLLGNHEKYVLDESSWEKLHDDVSIKHEIWIKSLLSEEDITYLRECSLRKEMLIDGKIFSFSHFLIEDENASFPFYPLDILKDGTVKEIVKNYEADFIFCGHYHDDFRLMTNEKTFQCIKSSGVQSYGRCSYVVIEVDNGTVTIKEKNIPYNREKFEKNIKSLDYPKREHFMEHLFEIK